MIGYDGMPNPGRNDECWCGSGIKYKKCHLDFDRKLEGLFMDGEELISRDLLKMPEDIEKLKASAAVNVGALDLVAEKIGPGVTTQQIDDWVHDYCTEHDSVPADLGFEGFPKSVCTSINEVVCHGIPSDDVVLKEGDIVNVDMSTIKDGYYSDSSRMFCIGEVDPEWKRLVDVCRESVEAGKAAIKPWGHLGDVSAAVNKVATDAGFSVVAEFGGHGIGFEFHEDPFVSFIAEAGTGPILVPGMCFTIEPMVNLGEAAIDMSDPNGWTVRTKDGKPTAQWEVQVVVTETGYELLAW
ncbi:MAG: methionyl aminopeptidase [Coriobacteriales bacterium]|jgi:methionyl aminopeptidase